MAEETTPAATSVPPAGDSVPETHPEKDVEQPAPEDKAVTKNGEKEEDTAEAKPAEKEGDDAAPASSEPTAANGTPASTKKTNNGKRKSTGGVPEHKKKLNKKKSSAKITHLDAQPGEYYFARLKSYSPWPSIICDEEMLPQSLLTTRPVTTKKLDGTYNEAYDDGGKRAYDRTFPIMFLHTNEFAWIPNTDLTPLEPSSCENVNEKGKAKALIAAYHVAAEGHHLQFFKDMLVDHQRALNEDQEQREAKAAAKAAKEDKKKRKSMDVVEDDDDVEMEDAEGNEGRRKSVGNKKRRKGAESDGENEKPTKTPKTATKLKLTTPKTPKTAETGKKAQSAKASKPKASSTKKSAAKAAASDEDAAAKVPKEPELTPQEMKEKKEKEVLYLRHKLQKGFLSRDQAPKEEEMAAMSNFIQKLEQYKDLEVSIIRTTKINKVLKAIIKLNAIPKDEEFNFRGRSVEILGKWKHLLESDLPKDEASGSKETEAEPRANGVHKKDADVNGKKGSETPATTEEKKDDEKDDEGTKEDASMADAADDETKKQSPKPADAAKEEAPDEGAEKTAAAVGEDVEMENAA